MNPGCFTIQESAEGITLHHAPERSGGSIPDDQVALQGRIYGTQRILNLLEGHVTHLPEYRRRLRQIAEAGLTGDVAQVALAEAALGQLHESVAWREGRAIKLRYLIKLGRWALAFALLALILYWDHQARGWTTMPPFYLVWAGAMAGVWVSVASSRARVEFESLPDLLDHRTEPVIRLLFAGSLSWILSLFLVAGALKVEVGSLKTLDLAADLRVALLVGVLSGFTEKALSLRLVQRAHELVGAGSGPPS